MLPSQLLVLHWEFLAVIEMISQSTFLLVCPCKSCNLSWSDHPALLIFHDPKSFPENKVVQYFCQLSRVFGTFERCLTLAPL